jgi:hypothetical protein
LLMGHRLWCFLCRPDYRNRCSTSIPYTCDNGQTRVFHIRSGLSTFPDCILYNSFAYASLLLVFSSCAPRRDFPPVVIINATTLNNMCYFFLHTINSDRYTDLSTPQNHTKGNKWQWEDLPPCGSDRMDRDSILHKTVEYPRSNATQAYTLWVSQ